LRARKVSVLTGLREGGFVQLLETDLAEDARVIANPVDELREGQKIRVVDGWEPEQ